MSDPARKLIRGPWGIPPTDSSPSDLRQETVTARTLHLPTLDAADITGLISQLAHTGVQEGLARRYQLLEMADWRRTDMAQEDWLRTLVEKMDQDRRDLETRLQASVQKIEHLVERQTDAMEATRREIQGQNTAVNSRIDQAYAHFQSLSSQVRWALIATIVGVLGLTITAIIEIVDLVGRIPAQ